MQIDPHDIETKGFRRRWRGFDRGQVRAYLRDVAEVVRDDDYRRAGDEVATALRRMHELVTALVDEAERDAAATRRAAIVDAEVVLAEARRSAEELRTESEAAAGAARFEAAVWATRVRAEAEVDRRAAEARVEEAREEVERLELAAAQQAEEAVERELQTRQLDVERVERRMSDLETKEIGVVARLRKIGREIAALVEAPIDLPPVEMPARAAGEPEGDGVVLDLTGATRVDGAFQSGLRRALRRPD